MFKSLSYDWATDFALVGPIGTFDFVHVRRQGQPAQDRGRRHCRGEDRSRQVQFRHDRGRDRAESLVAEVRVDDRAERADGAVPHHRRGGHRAYLRQRSGRVRDPAGRDRPDQAGTLRAIAVTSERRTPYLPDVPTIVEGGVPNYRIYSWNGIAVPAKTPRNVVMRLNKELDQRGRQPEESGSGSRSSIIEPRTGTPEDLQKIYRKRCERCGARSSSTLRSSRNDPARINRGVAAMNTVPKIDTATAQPANTIDPAEWETRVDLAAAYRLVDLYGMTDLHLNHISARVPGSEEHFLINPFGMMYEEITASSLIKIDLDGNIIANSNPNYGINLPGYVIHSAIHGARHDIGCVLHTHTNAGMAVSALKCGLLPLTQTAMRWGKVAYHDFEGVVVDLDEQKRLVENLGDSEVMILRNHGLLAVGRPSARRSTTSTAWSARARRSFWPWPATAEISMPPQEVIARSNAQLTVMPSPDASGKRRPHGSLEWPALKRMLDRRDPSVQDLKGRNEPIYSRNIWHSVGRPGAPSARWRFSIVRPVCGTAWRRRPAAISRLLSSQRPAAVVDFAVASHARAVAVLVVGGAARLPAGAVLQIPPVDRDEARFAQATKQMMETGDYVDIRFQDEVRYKKPVGIYWLQAGPWSKPPRRWACATRCHDLALSHSLADRRGRRGAADLLGGARVCVAPRRACWPD